MLTGNETDFTDLSGDGWTPKYINEMRTQDLPFRCHSFELARADVDIEHRLTKPRHPWTKGQAERMNRTIEKGYRQALPPRDARPAAPAPHRLCRCIRLRMALQDPSRARALRSHLQSMHGSPQHIHIEPAPRIPGAKQQTNQKGADRAAVPGLPGRVDEVVREDGRHFCGRRKIEDSRKVAAAFELVSPLEDARTA